MNNAKQLMLVARRRASEWFAAGLGEGTASSWNGVRG
jgi:hypothetical protein